MEHSYDVLSSGSPASHTSKHLDGANENCQKRTAYGAPESVAGAGAGENDSRRKRAKSEEIKVDLPGINLLSLQPQAAKDELDPKVVEENKELHQHPNEPTQAGDSESADKRRYSGIELQPMTRPILLQQLVNEVKGIYVGLVLVENKCIEIDAAGGSAANKYTDEQWQAIVTLHRTLLHEHHDFMLASQHPTASPALRRLAQKYAMPARMWRHGIHSFLEVLRHSLPEAQEHMVTFIYMAYSMVALLYETVPAFGDTWIECLGDLSRYRMAIEDNNQRVRDNWADVSRGWYTLAADHAPTTGRLYHHLAILARPCVVTQLFYYVKSLCVLIPFTSTHESILTLFDPILAGSPPRVASVGLHLTKLHAMLYTGRDMGSFLALKRRFISTLDNSIASSRQAWNQTGAHIAVIQICAVLGYGADDNSLMQLLRQAVATAPGQGVPPFGPAHVAHVLNKTHHQVDLERETDRIVFSRLGDHNCYGYIHVRMIWLNAMVWLNGMAYIEGNFLWERLVDCLNCMMDEYHIYPRLEQASIMHIRADFSANDRPLAEDEIPSPPRQRAIEEKPLPEDWSLRGLLFAQHYLEQTPEWFNCTAIDDGERMMESPAQTPIRRERILWLAVQLAKAERWIRYDRTVHRFFVAQEMVSLASKTLRKIVPLDDQIASDSDEVPRTSMPNM